MRPVGLAVTVLLALSAALTVPARGLGANANVVTTSRYLRAEQIFVRARAVDLTAAHTAAQALVAQVRAECPAVILGAPDEENMWVSGELGDAVQVAFARADRRALLAFVRQTRQLRWTSRHLTVLVRARAKIQEARVSLVLPHVCSDLRAWTESGYRVVPASTKTFVLAFNRANAEESAGTGGGDILEMMTAHEHRAAKRTAGSIAAEDERYGRAYLPAFLNTADELFAAAGAPKRL